ncbi:Small subunit (SSU) processome component [Coemansia sp. RSA 552]|nr:Small subunit (SSU) processome component [Coemansia sp. RSA 552]
MGRKTVYRKKSQSANSAQTTRTSIATDVVERWTCAFANDTGADSSLALVRTGIHGNKLRIIDAHTGTQRCEFANKSDEGPSRIHAVAWGQLVEKQKSRSKKQQQQQQQQTVVAMGLQTGEVHLYSPARDAVVRTVSGSAGIVDVAFAGDWVFSLDAHGTVVQWDSGAAQAVRTVKTGLTGAQKLLVSGDAQRVVVASHRMELWDMAKDAKLQSYPGHTSNVHSLLWAADETLLVSAAHNDRHVHIWETSPSTPSQSPRAVLAADSDALYIDVSPQSGSVLAVGEDGILYCWHQIAVSTSASKRKDIGYAADGLVRIISSADDRTPLPVLLARFSRVAGDENTVLLVRGSALRPVFESLALTDDSGLFLERERTLSREPQDNLIMNSAQTDAQRQLAAQLHSYSEASAKVSDPVTDSIAEANRAADQPAPSLADRIRQLSVDTENKAEGGSAVAAGLKLSAGTLVRVLVQSLHTSDDEMLDTVLGNSSRTAIVRDTVLHLPTAYVLPFLQQLFVRFHSTPARAHELLPWIRNALAFHSSYLVAIPSLVPQLSGFYQGIEQRLDTHQRLLRLSGRLELANSQIRAKSLFEKEQAKRDAQKQSAMQPLNVYRESDDEDSDVGATEPPTPVWLAEESTDAEDEEVPNAEDEQWSDDTSSEDGDAESDDAKMDVSGESDSSSSDDDLEEYE